MNKAHVFQHKYTGLQLFVYHQPDEVTATNEVYKSMSNTNHWIYIGQKVAQDV